MLPDMAASSTSRPDTQETAAYAASQPLFDVLRGAISRIEEQKVYLTSAKDAVQHIHVKVPQEHIENNGTLPTDYRDSLVTAWKITTESYVRIFEQLCELTGPDPAAGRQAEDSYAGFQKLLYTAEAARTVAFEQDAENEKARGEAESASESASSGVNTPNHKTNPTPAEVASSKRVAASEPSPTQNAPRPAKKQRITPSESTGTPAEEATTSRASEQSVLNTVQRLKPKKEQKERKQRIQQHRARQEQQQQATIQQPQPDLTPATTPQVQYADLTAEVDARLRAREEQKKAKAKAKKRKRDSQGSHILEAEPGAEKEAIEVRAKALAQKPAKKRAKSANGEGVRVDGQEEKAKHVKSAKGKRGAEEENLGKQKGGDEGARRSKRKKT